MHYISLAIEATRAGLRAVVGRRCHDDLAGRKGAGCRDRADSSHAAGSKKDRPHFAGGGSKEERRENKIFVRKQERGQKIKKDDDTNIPDIDFADDREGCLFTQRFNEKSRLVPRKVR